MDGEKAAEEGAAEEGAVRAGAAGGGGTGGGATIAGRSGSWTRGAGVPRGMVRGSSGDGDGGRTGTGGLRGGRFRRGAGLDKLSSSSRLISVGREGARWASAVTAGMGLLSRLGVAAGHGARIRVWAGARNPHRLRARQGVVVAGEGEEAAAAGARLC